MTEIIAIQHTAAEGLGLFGPILSDAGVRVRVVLPEQAIGASALAGIDGVIVLGGPMGVYETAEHPRLVSEMRLVEQALSERLPFLGICLGSQLLASVLGARVYRGPAKELGWLDVTRTPAATSDRLFSPLPDTFPALHWHGDVFELPAGTISLARSDQTRHQAFAYDDHAWGLLFHLEADVRQTQAMCHAFEDELLEANVSTLALISDTAVHEQATRTLARKLFGKWVELVVGETSEEEVTKRNERPR